MLEKNPVYDLDGAIKLLEDSRNLIGESRRWCKNKFAVLDGYKGYAFTRAASHDACQWCASGAMIKVFADIHTEKYLQIMPGAFADDLLWLENAVYKSVIFWTALRFLAGEINGYDERSHLDKVLIFNDLEGTEHEDVVKIFDGAIAEAKGMRDRPHFEQQG